MQTRVEFVGWGVQPCHCLTLAILLRTHLAGKGIVGAWHGEVPVASTLEPSLPPAIPRASKGIPSFFQGPSRVGLALVGSQMAEVLAVA